MATIKDIKVKVNIETNSQLKYMKPRALQFTIKESVETEIDQMEKGSILKSVSVFHISLFQNQMGLLEFVEISESSY